jgi:basic membrane protein A
MQMRKVLIFLLAGFLITLSACGGEEEPPSKTEEKAVSEKEVQEPATEDKELKVGFVYVSPVGDAGWSFAHDKGRQLIEEMDGVTTSYVESVPEGADAERVIANMADKGYGLIFTTSFGYMDPTLKVAKEFPDTVFMHCSGYKTSENMGNYFGRMYQARYLSGMVAGAMSESGTLGYVAAFPIPEVIRGINAFTLGVRSANPEAEVRVVWTKTWYDPATEKEAAKSLLDVGADVIAQHQDSPGPQEAAQEAGAYSVGYNSDMSAFAPKAHLTAPVWNWGVLYKEIVQEVKAGEWQPESLWWGIDTGIVSLAPYGEMVPADVRETVDARKQEITSGDFEVFAGPIKGQDGTAKVTEGEAMTDEEMLGMTWFVEGVIGSTE